MKVPVWPCEDTGAEPHGQSKARAAGGGDHLRQREEGAVPVCARACVDMCIYTCVCAHTYAQVYVCIRARLCSGSHVCACMCL